MSGVDGFEHPLGGYDLKLMAEQLAAVMDLASGLAVEVNTLKAQIESMSIQQPAPLAAWQPRNWRSNG